MTLRITNPDFEPSDCRRCSRNLSPRSAVIRCRLVVEREYTESTAPDRCGYYRRDDAEG